MSKLKMGKTDGSYMKEIAWNAKHDLLILDDFRLQTVGHLSRSAVMKIIEDRHSKRSTIITSRWPISDWHEIIGERTVADVILDRIVYSAHRMELEGPSLREKLSGKQTHQIELH